MARSRFDFHCEDTNGNSIVSAKVNVYVVGTTTAVTDCYTAVSGGSPVTNLVSGSDGIITGYLDTPKDVDLQVTDNNHTATIVGISGPRTFSAYTKTRTVLPPAGSLAVVISEHIRVKDPLYGANGNGSGDDTAAIQAAEAHAEQVGADEIVFERGGYPITPIAIASGKVKWRGAGRYATILTPTGSSGYAITVTNSAHHTFEDMTIDGGLASGTAGAFKLDSGVSNVHLLRVDFTNWTTSVPAVLLNGALDNSFTLSRWASCKKALAVQDDGGSFPSNDNHFLNCKFEQGAVHSGSLITVRNSEGVIFREPLIQGNGALKSIDVTGTAGSPWLSCAGFAVLYPWFEQNGGGQSGSVNVALTGSGHAGDEIQSPRIIGGIYITTTSDNPTYHIKPQNTSDLFIDQCYSQASYFVKDGTGNSFPRWGDGNKVAGTVDGSMGWLGRGLNGVAGNYIWGYVGNPNGVKPGNAGDLLVRQDTPSTANQRLYFCTSGTTWVALSV